MPPTKKAAAPAKKTPARKTPPAGAARATAANRFVVDLGGLQIPDDLARQIEAQIRKVTLNTVAGLDFQGDLQVSNDLRALGATRGIRLALSKTQLNILK